MIAYLPPQIVICVPEEDTIMRELQCADEQAQPAPETKPVKPVDGGATPQSGGGGNGEPPRPK